MQILALLTEVLEVKVHLEFNELNLRYCLLVSGTILSRQDRYSRGIPDYKIKVCNRIVTHKQGLDNDFTYNIKHL